MVTPAALQAFLDWVDRERSIRAVTLFGTQAQGRAGAGSDFDVQIVTTRPDLFEDRHWTSGIPGWRVRAYAVRDATGGARKATLLLEGAEFDLVIVPAKRLRVARMLVVNQHPNDGLTTMMMMDGNRRSSSQYLHQSDKFL